jgi:hypothetical protein
MDVEDAAARKLSGAHVPTCFWCPLGWGAAAPPGHAHEAPTLPAQGPPKRPGGTQVTCDFTHD